MRLCECGCGKEVKINFDTGEPNRFLRGHGNRSKLVQEKKKQSYIRKYGVDNPMKSKSIKQKTRETCLKKYGVENPMKSISVKKKSKNTCLEKYGVDNFSKTFEFRKFAREQLIQDIQSKLEKGQVISPRKGKKEIFCIEELQKNVDYQIINNAVFFGYFPDGYIKELNLVIEFDEPWHELEWSKKHDKQKDKDYIENGLYVFRIREEEWNQDSISVINNFRKLIEDLR